MNRFTGSRLLGGYTLVEILVATTLSLLLMAAVVRMFGDVGEGITASRSLVEAADRLRVVEARLQQDLAGITVTMDPPCRPEDNSGYFEYIEGPVTQDNASTYAVNTDNNNAADTTVGDFDDILMFTTRSTGRPFVGRCTTAPNGTIQSDVAEVAWFLRGRTLHRRILLVAPNIPAPNYATYQNSFYNNFDLSARVSGGAFVLNTLSDLTRRECRFAHAGGNFPYSVAANWNWVWRTSSATTYFPTLPTLNECTFSSGWAVNQVGAPPIDDFDQDQPTPKRLDFWSNVAADRVADNAITDADGTRIADDVILTNVIGFDVKVWEPRVAIQEIDVATGNVDATYFPGESKYETTIGSIGQTIADKKYVFSSPGMYVDLGFGNVNCDANYINSLSHLGHYKSRLNVTGLQPRTYDTWSTSYEATGTGLAGDLPAGNGINGFDDAGQNDTKTATAADGIVDSRDELVTSPPYPVPLRGIQVKIRVFEPDSRQIREVTVVQDFLPQ